MLVEVGAEGDGGTHKERGLRKDIFKSGDKRLYSRRIGSLEFETGDRPR